jgi:hypothetical protein
MAVGLSIISFGSAYACINDIQCGVGNVCAKPAGAVSLQGVCVTPTDEYGNKTYPSPSTYGPREIGNCQFNSDCEFGFSCMKRFGEIYGICLK